MKSKRRTTATLSLILILIVSAMANSQTEDVKSLPDERSIEPFASPQLVSRALSLVPGNQPVIQELGILDYQLEQIKELRYETQTQIGGSVKSTSKLSSVDRKAAFQKVYDKALEELRTILLPLQADRLMQLSVQSYAISNVDGKLNLASLCSNRAVHSYLNISSKTFRELRQKIAEEEAILKDKIRKLQDESRSRVLQTLAPVQRAQLEQMVGEPFDFKGYSLGRGGRFRKTDHDDH